MNIREWDILTALPLIVLLFSMYEVAGLSVPGWHTISYLASQHVWLKILITVLFLVGGISGATWFYFFHAIPGRVPR